MREMGFLAPFYLWLIILLSIPFLLSIWQRRKPILAISALWLWEESSTSSEPGKKLYRPRIEGLFWPFVALISIILALAQPYLIFYVSPPQDIIIILDASASMQTLERQTSRLNMGRKRIAQIIREQKEGTRFMLIRAGMTPEVSQPFTTERELLLRSLENISCDDTPSNLLSALSLAEGYSREQGKSPIYLVSDLAERIPAISSKADVIVVQVGSSSNNVGLVDLNVQREELGSAKFNLSVVVKNYSEGSKSFPITFFVDGRVFDSEIVALQSGQSKRILRWGIDWGFGQLKIELGLQDDLSLDNQVYALLSAPDKMPVALVSSRNLQELEKALLLHPEIELTRIIPQMLKQADLSNYRMIIYHGVIPAAAQGLPIVSIEKFDETAGLSEPAGMHVETDMAQEEASSLSQTGQISSEKLEWNPDHPLMKDLDWDGVFLTGIKGLPVKGGVERILWNGSKTVMTGEDRWGAKIVTLGFNPVNGNFPLNPVFPIFWYNVITWFRGDDLLSLPFLKTGGNYSFLNYVTKDRPGLELLSSAGEKAVLLHQKGGALNLELKKAGWYHLKGEQFHRMLAVNFLNDKESDIKPKGWPEIAKKSDIESGRAHDKSVVQSRYFLEKLFVSLGFGAMIMEWLRRRRLKITG